MSWTESELRVKDDVVQDPSTIKHILVTQLRTRIDSLSLDLTAKETNLRDLNANNGFTITHLRADIAGLKSELRGKDDVVQGVLGNLCGITALQTYLWAG